MLHIALEKNHPALRRRIGFRKISGLHGVLGQTRHISADPPQLRGSDLIGHAPGVGHHGLVLSLRAEFPKPVLGEVGEFVADERKV